MRSGRSSAFAPNGATPAATTDARSSSTRALHSDAVHVWLDIEDDSDWLGDIDLETLPTLLVLHGDRPMFFGPVLPYLDIVDRTLRALKDNGPTGDPVPDEFKHAVDRVIRELAET